MSRCCLRSGHSGAHLFVTTKRPEPVLGECAARPERKGKAILPFAIKVPTPQPPPPPMTEADHAFLGAIDEGWGR